MTSQEKTLWLKVQSAFLQGKSLKILEDERKTASKLVEQEKCFWSVDHDHIMAYDKDHNILTTGNL